MLVLKSDTVYLTADQVLVTRSIWTTQTHPLSTLGSYGSHVTTVSGLGRLGTSFLGNMRWALIGRWTLSYVSVSLCMPAVRWS